MRKKLPEARMLLNNCREKYILHRATNVGKTLEELRLRKSGSEIIGFPLENSNKSVEGTNDSHIKSKFSVPKNQQELIEEQDKLISLIRDCYLVQLEDLKNRKELNTYAREQPIHEVQEGEEVGLLKDLLKGGSGAYKSKGLNNVLKKYYKKQNKFVSYRLFRENYLQVVDNLLRVFETEEK